MEGDAVYLADPVAIEEFQSTPSVWRETAQSIAINSDYKISIHSLRMEGDADAEAEARGEGDFNPLPPYGGRHFPEQKQDSNGVFQSTPSVWRGQQYAALVLVSADISIHSLRMEGDRASRTLMGISQYFNSLPPYGGRRVAQ